MATFVNDTFTGTDGTTLASHTPDDGGTWQITSTAAAGGSSSGVTAILSSGTLTANAPGLQSSLYRHSASPATAEYDITAEFIIGTTSTSNDYWNLVGRLTATGTTDSVLSRYCASYRGAGTGWRILKNINGTATVLAQAATSVTGTKSVKFEIRNATKTLYVDGVSTVSTTDNTITQVGKVGLGAPDDQSVNSIDNLLAADPVGSTVSINAPTATATGSAPAPSVSGKANVQAVTATATGTALAPTVSGKANVTAVAAAAAAAALAPAVTVSVTIHPPAPTSTASLPAPSVSADSTITAVTATSTAQAPAPSVTGNANVLAVTATCTGLALAPAVTAEVNLTAALMEATGLMLVPAVVVVAPVTPRGPYYATLTASRQTSGALTARQASGVLTASRQVSGELTD